MKDIDLHEYPHVEMAIQPLAAITKNRNVGFSKTMLEMIHNAFRSDNWFGGTLKKLTNNDPVIMDAFYHDMDELTHGVSTAANVNFKGPRKLAREVQIAFSKHYWSEEEGNEGEGTRAKKIVLLELERKPDIKRDQLAKILTEERVLNFRGRMTLPQNRTDADFKWGYQQVYTLMRKYMGLSGNSAQEELERQLKENQKLYWSPEGDGSKAKTIILRELERKPKIKNKKIAEVLTQERVLKLSSIMKLPQERTDEDFHWDSYQVKNIRTKYMSMDANG